MAMDSGRWAYPAEKFATARRILMAPHPNGEADSFVAAFHECELGLRNVRVDDLDDDAQSWVSAINWTLATTGMEDTTGRGTWPLKAESLGVEEKSRFASAVNGLADWFRDRFMSRE